MIVDIRMTGMSGLELQALMRGQGVTIPFIVISAHGDVAAARQALLADAVDFLEKPFDGDALLTAVEAALQVSRALDQSGRGGREDASQRMAGKRHAAVLSPREQEVKELLLQGMDNRRIAEALGISHRTVEVHKARVLEKLDVDSVIELVRSAQRQGDGSQD